ncbi:MAG: enolase C-terminal domain-like protein, partial [Pseudomonadota bacterium]
MKITAVCTKIYEWTGPTEAPAHKLCVNPLDIFEASASSGGNTLKSFTFHAWLVVEVDTDAGHMGLGNAALSPFVTASIIDHYLRDLLIGQDVWDIERLWQLMYRRTIAFGRKGAALAAISAIDIALWDILGKAVGKPTYKLLGGETRAKIPVYASKLYNQPEDALQAEAESYRAAGYQAMKMRLGYGPRDGAAGMAKNIRSITAVREVIGEEIDLMVETYMGWTFNYTKQMLPRLAPFHLRWLEEPLVPDEIEGYAELNRMGHVPIAGGEHEHSLAGFRTLIEKRAVDYLQFDTNRVGGITTARKIATLAEAFECEFVPHAGQMHNYHVVMSSYAAPMAEFFPPHPVEVGNEL